MIATIHSNGRSRRLNLLWLGLLAVAVAAALVMSWPGAAVAKKHSHSKCHAIHAKSHVKRHTKAARKHCGRRVSRRHPRRSTATGPNSQAQHNATTTVPADDVTTAETGDGSMPAEPAEVTRCNREQASDPAGFTATYGVGPAYENAYETCLQGPQDSWGAGSASTGDDSG